MASTRFLAFICLGLLFLATIVATDPPQPKRKRQGRPEPRIKNKAAVTVDEAEEETTEGTVDLRRTSTGLYTFKSISECPPCPAQKQILKFATDSYWSNDILASYACACQQLLKKPDDGISQALIYSLTQSNRAAISVQGKVSKPTTNPSALKRWELLGPVNVGKLELDADPTFIQAFPDNSDASKLDIGEYLLQMKSNFTVHSEIASNGLVTWTSKSANENGEVPVQFNVAWNELVQSMSTMSVYEFQAWARITSYAKTTGSYHLSCAGPHTVYVRNDNMTHVLISDVYRSGRVAATLDLRIGLVGIVVPLRGMGQTTFRCELNPVPAAKTIHVHSPTNVPDLIEATDRPGKGYMFSGVFSIAVHNLQSHSIALEFGVEKPLGQEGEYFVRVARPIQPVLYDIDTGKSPQQASTTGTSAGAGAAEGEVSIAPGQTLQLSLELLPLDPKVPVFVSCRKNKPFIVLVTPSRGTQSRVPVDFGCRRLDQSFTFSYLDHDHSVTQAAVIFPLKPAPAGRTSAGTGSDKNGVIRIDNQGNFKAEDYYEDDEDGDSDARGDTEYVAGATTSTTGEERKQDGEETVYGMGTYPVLLSMHGSGITASSHADAHKQMRPGDKDYVFGVEGFIVVAPSRMGAHNWEAVGVYSARQAAVSLQILLHNSLIPLPQARLESSLSSGHSMGGHGGWMVALNSPNMFTCLAPLAGWINKEEYGDGNAFFNMDIDSSFTDPQLKLLLERSMSDTHTDKLLHNVQAMDVYLRVGSSDTNTHPWYSRRAYRLLKQYGVNATLEELHGKQHWWWDTDKPNDGGVINDPKMRGFYRHCEQKGLEELHLKQLYVNALNNSFSNEANAVPKDDLALLHLLKVTSPTPSPSSISSTSAGAASTTTARGGERGNPLALSASRLPRLCARNLTMTVINPGTHAGRCGLQVQQQFTMLSRTSVHLLCDDVLYEHTSFADTSAPFSSSTDASIRPRTCHLKSRNVRKLRIRFGYDSALFGVQYLIVDGVTRIDLSKLKKFTEDGDEMYCGDIEGNKHNNELNSDGGNHADGVNVGDRHEAGKAVSGIGDSIVDGRYIPSTTYFDLCWDDEEITPHACKNISTITSGVDSNTATLNNGPTVASFSASSSHPIAEKSPVNHGPIRHVYARPFVIVYGTPPNQALRLAMRDLAVYIGNAHYAAHATHVRILSDLEYRAGAYARRAVLSNIIFIGGPAVNKVMHTMCLTRSAAGVGGGGGASTSIPLLCDIPEAVQFAAKGTKDIDGEDTFLFDFQGTTYTGIDESIIFTLPFYRPAAGSSIPAGITGSNNYAATSAPTNKDAVAMAVCIHANAAKGYLHMSRLAWPVVPPMVRAPFALYVPDFMILRSKLWSLGFGGVLVAGFWNSLWEFDVEQAFVNTLPF